MFLALKTRIVSDKFQIAPSFLASIDIFLYVFLIWKKKCHGCNDCPRFPANDRIVTSRVACVDSRESSPVPREASFHEEATTRRRSSRFRADFYRGYDGENLPSRPFEDFSRRLTKRRINRRLSNAIIWLHDSSIERPSSFDFPSILFSPPRDFEICFP